MAHFLPKNAKQQMRERKRKKKLAEKLEKGEITEEEFKEQISAPRKRPLQQEESEPESNIVIIPKDLDPKDARMFRKKARRDARAKGQDDSKIQFVVEGQTPRNQAETQTLAQQPPRKKSKRQFPCINDMVKQEKEEKLNQAKIDARKQAEDQVPEEVKQQYVAIDCEMVGIGSEGKKSVLARTSLVDWHGNVLLDTFVQVPGLKVTDFRTHVSGVTPKLIRSSNAMDPNECRAKVATIIKNKIIVGHALKNDLHALLLTHTKQNIRDTANYRPFQRFGGNKWRPRKLRDLVKEHLDLDIQQAGEAHDSVDDARATMQLFKLVRENWEKDLEEKSLTKSSKHK